MAKAYLVVRIKGQADVPYWANTTLNLLNLENIFHLVDFFRFKAFKKSFPRLVKPTVPP